MLVHVFSTGILQASGCRKRLIFSQPPQTLRTVLQVLFKWKVRPSEASLVHSLAGRNEEIRQCSCVNVLKASYVHTPCSIGQ